MYEDFHALDRWSKQPIRCLYQALIVAIATRHADAVDIKFLAGDRPVWIALPLTMWVQYESQTGHKVSDPLAVQAVEGPAVSVISGIVIKLIKVSGAQVA